MSSGYPSPGCICEYIEDNNTQIAIVLEESNGKLRLLLPGRRETKLSGSRLLPWLGPVYSSYQSKEDMVRLLEQHRHTREQKAQEIDLMEIWALSQGEVEQAPAFWFASLAEGEPDEDTIAAYGRALLGCKTHFRFQPPEFQIYNEETVNKRLEEQRIKREREALASQGSAFLRMLWDVASHKRLLPPEDSDVFPPENLAHRIQNLLMARMSNPESLEDDALWRILGKGLPDVPHLPLQLLMAWGKLPPHYNFWLDRANYARGNDWWEDFREEVEKQMQNAANDAALPLSPLPFISIDGDSTIDIDDAFCFERIPEGIRITLAFACPAIAWPFGSTLDKTVLHRATSIYLPEGDLHMLPECLGTDAFSLHAGQIRPALCLAVVVNASGELKSWDPFLANVKLAANLRYTNTQNLISAGSAEADNPVASFVDQILLGHEIAQKREQFRIDQGAIVMLRQEPEISLEETETGTIVHLTPEKPIRDAQRLVSEMMILASACFADWAFERNIPLLHRTQNVALPKEYAGVWEHPADLARIIRSLIPSSLELDPHPHSALGLSRYAQVTSPLRRYTDLVNEAQIVTWLKTGSPRFDANVMTSILDTLSPALDAAGMAQRFRPRYWKLLYLRQLGEKVWHNGIITEENDNFVNVSLPVENIFVRGRRNVFEERATPGVAVKVRLGKINPLANDVQILEAMAEDQF